MTHAGQRCEIEEGNGKASIALWSDRDARKDGCIPVVKRGTVPQGIRFLIDRLDGGIDRMQEMLDDMKRDRDELRRKHGV